MNQAFILCVTLAAIAHGKDLRQTNVCPEEDSKFSSVYFPYPGDCSKFLQCSNGYAIVHTCPGDLVFDECLQVCNYRQNVEGECGTDPEEPPTTEGNVEITTEQPDGNTSAESEESTSAESDESTSAEAETEDTGVETTQAPTTETNTDGSGSAENICPEADGDYAVHVPHESDCTMFYKCNHGTPVLKVCPHNLWFNAALEVCDWPAQSGCEM